MKIKIKVKDEVKNKIQIISKGDWIDLYSAETQNIKSGECKLIDLGVAMKLPDGFEAIVAPRSSTFKYFSVTQANGIGIIDNSYCGNEDYWKFPAIAYNDVVIHVGDKICQFRIQLSQKASFWQKIKWLFSNKIELDFVDILNSPNRGGWGTTGK